MENESIRKRAGLSLGLDRVELLRMRKAKPPLDDFRYFHVFRTCRRGDGGKETAETEAGEAEKPETGLSLGIDAGVIGYPEHPCRLSGHAVLRFDASRPGKQG